MYKIDKVRASKISLRIYWRNFVHTLGKYQFLLQFLVFFFEYVQAWYSHVIDI